MNSSQRSSINNTTTYVIWRCLFHNILRWRAFRGELGSLAPTAAHTDSYSFQSPAEKVGNDPWRHVKEYWWNIPGSPRFTHPIFFTTPCLSLFHLSASHSVSPVSISLHLSVRPDLRLGVCLPSSVTASLHGRSSLRSSQPFGDCALGLTDVASPLSNQNLHHHRHLKRNHCRAGQGSAADSLRLFWHAPCP